MATQESFLLPGRYHYLSRCKLLRAYAIEKVLKKFKRQELTLVEIFQSLGISPSNVLIWIEYGKREGLFC